MDPWAFMNYDLDFEYTDARRKARILAQCLSPRALVATVVVDEAQRRSWECISRRERQRCV